MLSQWEPDLKSQLKQPKGSEGEMDKRSQDGSQRCPSTVRLRAGHGEGVVGEVGSQELNRRD